MYYNQSCGARYRAEANKGNYGRHFMGRSVQRAMMNAYKTDKGYEVMIFAPGRIKENFHIDIKGNDLEVSYTPPEGFPRPEWVHREYSRGGFVRTFTITENFDREKITAKYEDGVLYISLPLMEGKSESKTEIPIH